MDDVTALRDALLEALPSRYFHREDMDNLDVLAALDALIAAAEARAALTPERLAKALHETRGHRDLHPDFRGCSSCSPDAAAIIAAARLAG